MAPTPNMPIPPATFRRRRAKLAHALHRPIVLFAGEARARQYATNTYPFRGGSSYLYFGGPPLPGSALLIEPTSNGDAGCVLARPVMGFEDAVWTGAVPADDELAAFAGLTVNALIPPDQVSTRLTGRTAAHIAPPCPPTMQWAASIGLLPAEPDELLPIIEMRLTKDEHELTAMRRVARVGVEAHLAAIQAAQPGRRETNVAAALAAVLVSNQCRESFSPIVTVHGEVLHTDPGGGVLEAGQLLLIDAGAEESGGYASDITRTVPVGGRFTPVQRQLYDTVLRVQREAIAVCVPGRRFRDIHDLAARVLCHGLVEADLLRGDPADLVARRAHTLFFPHGLGHLIGLDVHDMEDFGENLVGYAPGRTRRPQFGNKFLRLDRDLTPGMTLTIEPGLYLVPAIWENDELTAPFTDVVNRRAVDTLLKQRFGGIRIEDTVCVRDVTASGPEVLTGELPTEGDAVAAAAGAAS